MFATVVDDALVRLPDAEAGLERTRLLGSPAAAGLGEAVFRMEAERPTPVVERLLEHALDGEFTFATTSGPRSIAIRGKADRIDLLADGTFRLIDYKLGWPPEQIAQGAAAADLQPVRRAAAGPHARAATGRSARRPIWRSRARGASSRCSRTTAIAIDVLAEAQQRLADDARRDRSRPSFRRRRTTSIAARSCSFAAVCRKDYVGDV